MSIKLMAAIWDNEDSWLQGSRLVVLLCLADHANDDGECWPSVARLTVRSRLHKTNVMRHLQELEAAGYLEIQRRSGKRNRYIVRSGRTDATGSATATSRAGATTTSRAGATTTSRAGATTTSRAGATTTGRAGATRIIIRKHHTETSEEPSQQPPTANGAAVALSPDQKLALELLLIAAPDFHNPTAFVRQHPAKLIGHWARYVAKHPDADGIDRPAAFINTSVRAGASAPQAGQFDVWWWETLHQRAGQELAEL